MPRLPVNVLGDAPPRITLPVPPPLPRVQSAAPLMIPLSTSDVPLVAKTSILFDPDGLRLMLLANVVSVMLLRRVTVEEEGVATMLEAAGTALSLLKLTDPPMIVKSPL